MAKAQTRAQIEAVIAPAIAAFPGATRTFEGYAASHGTAYRELLVLAILQERQRGLGKDMLARTHALLASPLFSVGTMEALATLIASGLNRTMNLPAVQITVDTTVSMVHGAVMLNGVHGSLHPSADVDALVGSYDITASPRRIRQVRGMIQGLLDNPGADPVDAIATDPRDVGDPIDAGHYVHFAVPGCDETYADGACIQVYARSMAHRPLAEVAGAIIPQIRQIARRRDERDAVMAQAERIRQAAETALAGTDHRVLSVRPLDQSGVAFHHDVTISGLGDDLRPAEIVLQVWPTPTVTPEAGTLDRFVTVKIPQFLRSQAKLASKGAPAGMGDYLIERPLARMLKHTFGQDMRSLLDEVAERGTYDSGLHRSADSGHRGVRLHMTMDRGVIRGRFDIAPGVHWHEGSFRMPQAMIPETVAQDMRGRPITDVVAHGWLDDSMVIEAVSRGANRGLTLSAHGATCTVAQALEGN